jgi:chemotaxis protein MotA
MDIGLLVGFILTWVLIVGSCLLGGSLSGYYDLPSVVLVVFGSTTLVFVTHPAGKVLGALRAAKKLFFPTHFDFPETINLLVSFAEKARRDGILALESASGEITDPFFKNAVQMVVDGTDPAIIEQILHAEIESTAERHDMNKSVYDALGKYAPAMGMIGTLVGLVVMLKNMSDPSAIGPGMAVALLTTLYGALISNGVTGPIADRMARLAGAEAGFRALIIRGILAIQAGDNPNTVRMKLKTALPPAQRTDSKPNLKLAA